MILIRFPNIESKRSALAQLAGRFRFTSWASGEMLVPEDALLYLADQGIAFTVEQSHPDPDWLKRLVGSMGGEDAFDEVIALGREQRDADRPSDGVTD